MSKGQSKILLYLLQDLRWYIALNTMGDTMKL